MLTNSTTRFWRSCAIIPLSAVFALAATQKAPPPAATPPAAPYSVVRPASSLLTLSSTLPALVAQAHGRPVVIHLLPGTVRVRQPIDIGAEPVPVTIDAKPGTVRLTGSEPVHRWSTVTGDALQRLPAASRGHVVYVDLRREGLRPCRRKARGFTVGSAHSGPELVCQGHPAPVARWPLAGWAHVAPGPTIANGFRYAAAAPAGWRGREIQVHGYWAPYADDCVDVGDIDTRAHVIHVAGHQSIYGYPRGSRWIAQNVLEELRSPGQYCIEGDRLYWWKVGDAEVTVAESLIRIWNTRDLLIHGITLDGCRGDAVLIGSCIRTILTDCPTYNAGGRAADIEASSESGLDRCDIRDTAGGGVVINAGDRRTLTAARCFVTNCRIRHYARTEWCYRPAVMISASSVGNIVANNAIYDCPHMAVLLGGNDNTVERNDIHDVCTEVGDAGVIYMGRDWTARGNVIQNNRIHDIPQSLGDTDDLTTYAVYLDDLASGTRVVGNVIARVSHAVYVAGGRDNVVADNVFVRCRRGVLLDVDRGKRWQAAHDETDLSTIRRRLAAMPYRGAVWSARYPELASIGLSGDPWYADHNVIVPNSAPHTEPWIGVGPK